MDRKLRYKNKGKSVTSLRNRRRAQEAETRKDKRGKQIHAKRIRQCSMSESDYELTTEQVKETAEKLQNKSDQENRSVLLATLRKAFSQGSALIDAFLEQPNSMQTLVGILTGSDSSLQLQAAWCLTNISAGTETESAMALKHSGSYLVTYLGSGNAPLQDQCAWAIGNMAGGSPACRDTLISLGALPALVKLLESPMPNVVKSAAFALSNLARDKAKTGLLVEAGILTLLKPHLVFNADNSDMIHEVVWVLAYIAASGEHAHELVELGLFHQIVGLVIDTAKADASNYRILTPSLRCLGNVCSSEDEEIVTETCKSTELIQTLGILLKSEHHHIPKETLWVLSNLSTFKVVAGLIIESDLLASIISLLASTFDVKLEAGHCLCNLCGQGQEQCEAVVAAGALQGMLTLLLPSSIEGCHLGLSFIEMFMIHIPGAKKLFEDSHGMDSLEALEYHQEEEIKAQCSHILETHFYSEDSELSRDAETPLQSDTSPNADKPLDTDIAQAKV